MAIVGPHVLTHPRSSPHTKSSAPSCTHSPTVPCPPGYYHGNVAIVRFGPHVIAAVRKMHFYKMLRTALDAYPIR